MLWSGAVILAVIAMEINGKEDSDKMNSGCKLHRYDNEMN
jgi:hypothetical protein